MEYVTATSDMVSVIYNILHTTIKTIYAKYYPQEVVNFFCRHHSKEHILDGITPGNMGVLVVSNVIVGTGCFDDNHITGVYVLPDYQKQGCGTYIMDCLETEKPFAYNVASCRVLEKAGFQYEGTLRSNAVKNGEVIDMKMYSLLKTEILRKCPKNP